LLLTAISQDPVLRRLKLIAEPWDIGPGGYQLGAFPPPWGEWNDRFRDTVRRFWRGEDGLRGELATRIAGSQDTFGPLRRPSRSINFVTAHDGFTLADLVSYNHKHNEANGEDNRDGSDSNHSWNCGIEGPTDDPAVLALRARQQRNLIATVLLSQGVPMILAGDEVGKSQGGNNNAYCQDSPLTWMDWGTHESPMHDFVASLIKLRRATPALRRETYFTGTLVPDGSRRDIMWLRPDGGEMTEGDWYDGGRRVIGMLVGEERPRAGDPLCLLFANAHDADIDVRLPNHARGWELFIDTAGDPRGNVTHPIPVDQTHRLGARSLAFFRTRQ
jgi:glycogen operon protein